eukprot:Platyproteum_vivax@DN547_c0_g1_i1.p1
MGYLSGPDFIRCLLGFSTCRKSHWSSFETETDKDSPKKDIEFSKIPSINPLLNPTSVSEQKPYTLSGREWCWECAAIGGGLFSVGAIYCFMKFGAAPKGCTDRYLYATVGSALAALGIYRVLK